MCDLLRRGLFFSPCALLGGATGAVPSGDDSFPSRLSLVFAAWGGVELGVFFNGGGRIGAFLTGTRETEGEDVGGLGREGAGGARLLGTGITSPSIT